jgi:hypothetical protein
LVQPVADAARAPETPIETRIVAALNETGNLTYDKLVQRVAHELYQAEIRCGGAVLDLGILGSALFERDVIETIRAANCVLWKVI